MSAPAPMTSMPTGWTHVFPLEGLPRGRLFFTHGVSPRVDVRGAPLGSDLARCRFATPEPRVVAHRGELSVSYQGFFRWFFGGRSYPGEVELNDAIPWEVDVAGGVARAEFDLRGVELTRFDVGGGIAHVRIRLGAPKAMVPLRIHGGAAHVEVTHPAGVGARVRITGGASHLRVGSQELGALGGRGVLESRGWDPQGPGYDVSVAGGAAHVSVTPETSG